MERWVAMSALADIDRRLIHVRFTLESGHRETPLGCPLCARSGSGEPRGGSALLDWNNDRLAFLRNKEIDSPRPLCRTRIPDEVNSLVRIGAEHPRFHH